MPIYTVVYREPEAIAATVSTFEEKSEEQLRHTLLSRGCNVLAIEQIHESGVKKLWRRINTSSITELLPRFGVSHAERALLCEVFRALYASGVEIMEVVKLSIEETPNPYLKKKLKIVLEHLLVGDGLAQAMSDRRCRRAFPMLMVETIRTGEANGRLEDALDRLIRTYKRMADIRRDTISAMIYPSLTILVFAVVCYGLAIKIPEALNEFVGAKDVAAFRRDPDFPFAIELLMRVKEHPIWLIFPPILIGAIIVACNVMMRFRATRYGLTLLQRWIPLIGKLLKQYALVRLLEVLSANHESGIAMGDSLSLVSACVDDALFERSLDRMHERIMSTGCSLAAAMNDPAEQKEFFGLVRQMVTAGEKSGKFTEMLAPIITYYEERSKALLQGIETAMTPVMIILLGLVVGPIVIGVYKVIAMAQMRMLG